MEQIMIYPYNRAYQPFVNHQDLMTGMEIVSLVSPYGWGLVGDKLVTSKRSYIVLDDFSKELSQASTVWFVDDDDIEIPHALLSKMVEEARNKGKKIIYTRKDGLYKEYTTPDLSVFCDYELGDYKNYIYDIVTPIVFILGTAEKTDKFEVQIGLHKAFKNKGYSVSTVGTRSDSHMLGVHSMPKFMFEARHAEVEKILMFKNYVKQIELYEQPDIIIIGIPGGAMPYDMKRHNNFGILAYEISMAVGCDCAILCSLYDQFKNDYFKKITEVIMGKFDVNVKFHHISPYMKGEDLSHIPTDFNFISLDNMFVKKQTSSFKKDLVYDLRNPHEMDCVANDIIEFLSADNNIELI